MKEIENITTFEWEVNGTQKSTKIVEWEEIKNEHRIELLIACSSLESYDIEQVVYHLSTYYEGRCPYDYESKCYRPWCECHEALNGCKGYY